MKKLLIFLIVGICFSPLIFGNIKTTYADSLYDNIEEQLNNINLEELNEYYQNLNSNNDNLFDTLKSILTGNNALNVGTFFEYFVNSFFQGISEYIPIMFSIIAIAIFCGIMTNIKGVFLSDSISDLIFFVCFSGIILIVSTVFFDIWLNCKNTINNIANLTEIMSPIILTLMIGSGGNVSAALYKPSVAFFSQGFIYIISSIVLPLIGGMIIMNILSNFSTSVKVRKFGDFFSSIVKWILGISILLYGIIITIQGISSASYDGLSAKIAKYTISNSVPLVGGLIKDGFDLVVAGSILLRNAIGVTVVIMLFYTILAPLLSLIIFSLLLKLCAAISEPIADARISDFCTSLSKSTGYIVAVLLSVGLMFFITVLLMMFSASSII